MFDEFQLDPVKYVSALSLTKDCGLKYCKCKIENIKDVSIFNFIRKAVMGGLSDSINPHVKLDDIKNETIAYNDISSQYPHELRKKLSYKDYRFVENLDENRYGGNQNYGCILLCDVKTTDEIRDACLYKQCPMLFSRCKITDKNLSKYQLRQIKDKRQNNNSNYNSQSEKLIVNLVNDSNCYLNFEMYQMMKKAGYKITIKKILEFKNKAIFKNYIEYLYSKKKQYSLQNKKSTAFIYKILMNSFYGSTLTNNTRFRDIRICTTKRQALKFTKLPNFHSYKIINENLIIIEVSKKTIFDSPILIGSQVLFNSKCNLYNYMYNIIPKLFGRENITFSFRDTDCIIYKLTNCPYEKYIKILKENSNLFGKHMGVMEDELDKNINEVISLRSKSNSIQRISDINIKFDNNHDLKKSKGISDNYRKKFHTHQYFRKIYFNEMNMKKAEYYKISLKNGKLIIELQIKDDISNFNDKRYMTDNCNTLPTSICICMYICMCMRACICIYVCTSRYVYCIYILL